MPHDVISPRRWRACESRQLVGAPIDVAAQTFWTGILCRFRADVELGQPTAPSALKPLAQRVSRISCAVWSGALIRFGSGSVRLEHQRDRAGRPAPPCCAAQREIRPAPRAPSSSALPESMQALPRHAATPCRHRRDQVRLRFEVERKIGPNRRAFCAGRNRSGRVESVLWIVARPLIDDADVVGLGVGGDPPAPR